MENNAIRDFQLAIFYYKTTHINYKYSSQKFNNKTGMNVPVYNALKKGKIP